MKRRRLSFLVVAGFLLWCGAAALAQQPNYQARTTQAADDQPFTVQTLTLTLRREVGRSMTEADLALRVERLGIAFDPTPDIIGRLRANGAHPLLINTIKRAAEKLSANAVLGNKVTTGAQPDPFSGPTAAPIPVFNSGPTAAPPVPTRAPVHELDEADLLDLPNDLAGLFDESPTGMRPNPTVPADPFASSPTPVPKPADPFASSDRFASAKTLPPGRSADPFAAAPPPRSAPAKDPFAESAPAGFASPSDFDDAPTGMRRMPAPGRPEDFDDAPTGMRGMPTSTTTQSLTPGLKPVRAATPPVTPTLSPAHGAVRTGNTGPARVPTSARDAAAGSEFELITDPVTADSLSLESLFGDSEPTNDPPTNPNKGKGAAPTAVPALRGADTGFVMQPTAAPDEDEGLGFSFADLSADEASDRGSPTLAPLKDRLDESLIFPMGYEEPEVPKRRPARVRLAYRNHEAFVVEYKANLRSGGALVVTDRPLATGRECVFEITSPGLLAPMVIPAHVSRVTPDGMEVVYDLDPATREAMLLALDA